MTKGTRANQKARKVHRANAARKALSDDRRLTVVVPNNSPEAMRKAVARWGKQPNVTVVEAEAGLGGISGGRVIIDELSDPPTVVHPGRIPTQTNQRTDVDNLLYGSMTREEAEAWNRLTDGYPRGSLFGSATPIPVYEGPPIERATLLRSASIGAIASAFRTFDDLTEEQLRKDFGRAFFSFVMGFPPIDRTRSDLRALFGGARVSGVGGGSGRAGAPQSQHHTHTRPNASPVHKTMKHELPGEGVAPSPGELP